MYRRAQLNKAGSKLLEFVIRQAGERGLTRVGMFFHGIRDEVDPLISLYREHGFQLARGQPRLEMLTRRLSIDPGPHDIRFRSAEEVGPAVLLGVEAAIQDWSLEQARENLEFSREMWSVPDTDWLAAYEDENPVGVVRMAVSREGVGVVDAFGLLREHRGRGLGICLLARGLSCLIGKTEVVRLDADHDNVPALRLFERAGFQVHHLHGNLTLEVTSV